MALQNCMFLACFFVIPKSFNAGPWLDRPFGGPKPWNTGLTGRSYGFHKSYWLEKTGILDPWFTKIPWIYPKQPGFLSLVLMIFLFKQVVFSRVFRPSLRREYLPSPTVARYANVDQFLPQQKVTQKLPSRTKPQEVAQRTPSLLNVMVLFFPNRSEGTPPNINVAPDWKTIVSFWDGPFLC